MDTVDKCGMRGELRWGSIFRWTRNAASCLLWVGGEVPEAFEKAMPLWEHTTNVSAGAAARSGQIFCNHTPDLVLGCVHEADILCGKRRNA